MSDLERVFARRKMFVDHSQLRVFVGWNYDLQSFRIDLLSIETESRSSWNEIEQRAPGLRHRKSKPRMADRTLL